MTESEKTVGASFFVSTTTTTACFILVNRGHFINVGIRFVSGFATAVSTPRLVTNIRFEYIPKVDKQRERQRHVDYEIVLEELIVHYLAEIEREYCCESRRG